ncbi:hypothetical protein GCM10010954_16480 [Halobacillus andaensis]|uniref:Uncharacterized protein n=1 Tax=Halobacillus andaensis TaxID=1176239 RepID=A0A917B3W3_HALAA|nr:hypothetical protein [Halobacillus andaensis]MBP2004850.1 putative RNA-binding protein [Halobacillus andaensis]GGF18429.1 hypothetical protein GCM10010954_16480 [Halobacillus andaensis]
MTQRIGNVGLLNLMNATEKSLQDVERIENIGMILYPKEKAYLLPKLNVGNIGQCVELPKGYQVVNSNLHVDQAYFQSLTEEVKLFVNGNLIVEQDVQADELKNSLLELRVSGSIYCPDHLTGSLFHIISYGAMDVESYGEEELRFENGHFELTNAYLHSADLAIRLTVNGKLRLPVDLDMALFQQKIHQIDVNGKVRLYESQETNFYKKAGSLSSSKVEVIPDGYLQLTKPLRVNSRSIKRFQGKKLYTNKPLIIEADVTRDAFSIASIHSTSIVICPEELEDLVYETAPLLETEVLSYEDRFLFIEGEERWTNEQLEALDHPTAFIVDGQLIIDDSVTPEVLSSKIKSLDILGIVAVENPSLKGSLQQVIRVNTGMIKDEGMKAKDSSLGNLGELML